MSRTLPDTAELVIIGAGPAGMAAALEARAAGVEVLLLDEAPAAGGQIWRGIGAAPEARKTLLGPDYAKGAPLAEAFAKCGAQHVPGVSVWGVMPEAEGGGRIGLTLDGAAHLLTARAVIFATGAQERPLPVPGWTLPGVMGAGAAQIALKSGGLLPEGRVVLAGIGPLLYLLADQFLRAGLRPAALIETPSETRRAALRHLPGFLRSEGFRKGAGLMARVRRNIRVISGAEALEVRGETRAEALRWKRRGRWQEIGAEMVLLHAGVIPSLHLAAAAGVPTRWKPVLRCFEPEAREDGSTALPGLFLAGDGATIGGADRALPSGRRAALAALAHLGAPVDPSRHAEALRAWRKADLGRAFIDRWFAPPPALLAPRGDTLVCRCEEISAEAIREAARLGAPGPNQIKTYLRCGMGPCQGRMCATSVTEIMADETGRAPSELGHLRLRTPVRPLRLGELAQLPAGRAAQQAALGDHPLPQTPLPGLTGRKDQG
ncbi:NAD(P)/FAD-dependent oxidoreductase [Salipiger sp. PrR002]|uniref:FAD/NAD(P)-dependent oxidoreductase n=1 Tax=Salipiger sp. PrR002 TaxID=2706489 RepID=UPI0013BC0F0F|nr:NAD(P)/FAD-dependent oxidoreductase [Salipiger sp. PrR002]NDW00945.1 FAD-dependent oxidoreductase [Salipiger sp. PrR002]NDW56492.1 FAD-dependent oxidoreductase [Salipiger sp. PrR004]